MIPKFESHLPDEYSRLMEAIDMLPGASHSPFSPMSSLVVNLNISMLAHRDSFNKELCLVMPVGEFDGGAGSGSPTQEWGHRGFPVCRDHTLQHDLQWLSLFICHANGQRV